MKTLFLSITHGFQARDLLRTDVLQTLLAAGVRVVILTPNHRDPYFVREFNRPGVVLEPLHTDVGRLEAAMGTFRRYVLASFKLNRTLNALNERFYRARSPKYLCIRALNAVFGRVPVLRRLWMRLEAWLFPGHEYEEVFRRYCPDLLVTGTPGSIPADAHLLRWAQRHGVRTACVVLSWDNLTSKGHMAAVPQQLIVWNRIMEREARELHGYPADRIHVAGVSHFDVYARPSAAGTRERFCVGLGLEPSRALITLGTVTPWLFPHNAEVAEILARAVAEGRFTRAAQLLIRLHPQVMNAGTQHSENLDRFREIAAAYAHVHLDLPAVRSDSLMWDVAESDMTHLADLLRYSDVTLNAGSTLTIDSAIMDSPIVNIGFDGFASEPPEQSVIRIYDFTHYANIVRSGGVRIARSADEMLSLIDAYLADPSLDREGRARIVDEQCGRVDGGAGLRVAALLMSFLGLPPPARNEREKEFARAIDREPAHMSEPY
jgi:hypothetical protein